MKDYHNIKQNLLDFKNDNKQLKIINRQIPRNSNFFFNKVFKCLNSVTGFVKYNSSKQEHTQKLTEIHEKIDIELIRQQLAHDAYSSEQMYMLCMFIMAECKTLQAPQFDDVVDELYANLKQENFLPRFLREISVILQITTTDILEFREAARKTQGLDDSQNN